MLFSQHSLASRVWQAKKLSLIMFEKRKSKKFEFIFRLRSIESVFAECEALKETTTQFRTHNYSIEFPQHHNCGAYVNGYLRNETIPENPIMEDFSRKNIIQPLSRISRGEALHKIINIILFALDYYHYCCCRGFLSFIFMFCFRRVKIIGQCLSDIFQNSLMKYSSLETIHRETAAKYTFHFHSSFIIPLASLCIHMNYMK